MLAAVVLFRLVAAFQFQLSAQEVKDFHKRFCEIRRDDRAAVDSVNDDVSKLGRQRLAAYEHNQSVDDFNASVAKIAAKYLIEKKSLLSHIEYLTMLDISNNSAVNPIPSFESCRNFYHEGNKKEFDLAAQKFETEHHFTPGSIAAFFNRSAEPFNLGAGFTRIVLGGSAIFAGILGLASERSFIL